MDTECVGELSKGKTRGVFGYDHMIIFLLEQFPSFFFKDIQRTRSGDYKNHQAGHEAQPEVQLKYELADIHGV